MGKFVKQASPKAKVTFANIPSEYKTPGSTFTGGGFHLPINPKLTGEESAAIAADEVFTPLAQGLKKDTEAGVFNSPKYAGLPLVGNAARTYRQWAVGQPNALLTSYDPKLQATQGKVNSIRRYIFGEGGKQLTPYEANIVNALLKPTGKSDQQYETDLDEAVKLIQSKARHARGGLMATLPQRPVQRTQQTGISEADIQETMRANNMTREQVLKALGA